MNARFLTVIFGLLFTLGLTGCGTTIILRHVPMNTAPTMQFSRPAVLPPPPAYLQRKSGCSIVDHYRGVTVERCRRKEGNDRCVSHTRYTDLYPNMLSEVQMHKDTVCSWSNGRRMCERKYKESARLIPKTDQYGQLYYEKVDWYKSPEIVSCGR